MYRAPFPALGPSLKTLTQDLHSGPSLATYLS